MEIFWTVPNILTMLRILLVAFLVVFFYMPVPFNHEISASLFFLAAITDWLDGILARRFKQITSLGAFLDPVADKLIVGTALGLLISLYPYSWVTLPSIIIICREILVSALREWMAEIGQRSVVKVSFIGKIKTVAQMSAIFILLLNSKDLEDMWVILGFLLLYLAVILTVYSTFLYLSAAYKAIKKKEIGNMINRL